MKKTTLAKLFGTAALALTIVGVSPQDQSVKAQDKPIRKIEKDEEAPSKDTFTIPFRYEGLLFCDVSINGSAEKFNFLIDSGAAQSVLSLRVAERLGLDLDDAPGGAGGVGKQDMKLASNVEMTVQGRGFKPAICGVLDTSHINDKSEMKLEGILGADWMATFKKLHFNFKTLELEITQYPGGKAPGGGMGDMMKGLGGLLGGDKEDKSDYDDDGIESEESVLAKKVQDLMRTNLARHDVPQITTILQSVGPTVGANEKEDKEMPGSKIEGEIKAAASKRFLQDAKLEASTIDFKNVTLNRFGQKLTLSAWWIVECDFNGKRTEMVFDTGASSLAVLDNEFAKQLDVGHSLSVTVAGVGTSEATFGMLESYAVGGLKTTEDQPAILLDLSAIRDQFKMFQMIDDTIKAPTGLLGLPFAMRYREMTVNNETKKISFKPYTEAEIKAAEVNPHESNVVMAAAIKNVWSGKAGSTGFKGEGLNIVDWPDESETGGVVVTQIRKGSSAAKNGLEKGDLILAVIGDEDDPLGSEREPVADYDTLKLFAAYVGKGQKWSLLIKKKRTGKTIVQEFTLGPIKSSKVRAPKRFRR